VRFNDLRALAKAVFRLSVFVFLLKAAAWFRDPRSPGEF
jgi:hypothetical protein